LIYVHEDKQHVIWVGTSSGINRFTGEHFNIAAMAQGASAYTFMRNDAAGHLYAFESPQGIIRVEGNRLIPVADSPRISSMAQAGKDIWFCGNGIYRAAGDALWRWERDPDAPQEYVRFGRPDGMKSAECNTGSSALAVTNDGKVWAATAQGLAMIDSARLPHTQRKPRIYMRQMVLGRTVAPAEQELEIPAGTSHVELNFDVVELGSPEKTRLQYRLDGVDQEWLDAGPGGRAIYTSLPPGTHKLRVRGCSGDGVWDASGVAYEITQEPFFYEAHWFRYSMGTLLFMLLAAGYQFRLHRLVARLNARFEERLAERTLLERRLQDTLMQTIQGSMVITDTALSETENPAAIRKTLEKLSQWLSAAMQESRVSLKALRNSRTPTNLLVEALQRVGEECVSNKRIEISLAVDGSTREMHALVRDEIHQIGAEAIRNACQRPGSSMVEVELSYGRDFSLRVSDNGKTGAANASLDGNDAASSLQIMQERAARIGGKLRVVNSGNPPRKLELIVPGSVAFTEAKTEWLSRFRTEPPV
jgi:signal transduction histidine kinase